ncbi:hypothetical protein CRM22_000072 [Opisthorchis felineus]|nr:hypothetical protein CRM22_000072 [Opisthorchis felineus]
MEMLMNVFRKVCHTALITPFRGVGAISHRSFKLTKAYDPQMHPGVGPNLARNNVLPKEYELMMQKVLPRLGSKLIGKKRLTTILLSRREKKFSEAARLSTPEGRIILHQRLIRGRRSLWKHDW